MKTFLAGALVASCVTAGVNHVMAAPSTKASITACAHKKTGVLRVKTGKKCKSSERLVEWPSTRATPLTGAQGPAGIQGVQGPAGIQGVEGQQGSAGPAGAQGTDGPIGANGLSKAYQVNFLGGQIRTDEPDSKPITGINLPAGNFIITANLIVASGSPFTGTCQFGDLSLPSTIGLRSIATISGGSAILQTHISLPDDDVLVINCQRLSGDQTISIEGSIYAVAVDTITEYDPDLLDERCPSSRGDKSSVRSMVC
jgi:hypothetical protein